jgi:hypothetical protein
LEQEQEFNYLRNVQHLHALKQNSISMATVQSANSATLRMGTRDGRSMFAERPLELDDTDECVRGLALNYVNK